MSLIDHEFLSVKLVIPNGSKNVIVFGQRQILIDLSFVMQKNGKLDWLDVMEDQLVTNYTGQELWFYAADGADVKSPIFTLWLESIQHAMGIASDKIFFVSVSPSLPQWNWVCFPLVAFKEVIQRIGPDIIPPPAAQRKFVGFLASSRPTVNRMRMAYLLAKTFPNDNWITFNAQATASLLDYPVVKRSYEAELQWMHTHPFDKDNQWTDTINYIQALPRYVSTCANYAIEVITETDDYQNQWFTDKTAKCLRIGKPFVLMSGQHSLRNLKRMGFVTFDQWIDESYDDQPLPLMRTAAIVRSLEKLYRHPDRHQIIEQMYDHAKANIEQSLAYVHQKV